MKFSNYSLILPFILVGISLLTVAFAQPDWSLFCCVATSAIGYALFWRGMLFFPERKKRFTLAALWFAGVQLIHLSWFTSDRYVGEYIYLFLFLLVCALGICFGLLSLFIPKKGEMNIGQMLGFAGGWTLFEWGRLFILSGFSWDPIGLSLTSTVIGMQLASAFGMFGFTFWVLFTNAYGLKMLVMPFQKFRFCTWVALAITPYLFGLIQISFHTAQMKKENKALISAVLVQTALYPEQKVVFSGQKFSAFTPLDQWKRILNLLKEHVNKSVDLIALSEAVVPYGTDIPLYTVGQVTDAFTEVLGSSLGVEDNNREVKVGNAYWVHALANLFQADVVIGLEDAEFPKESPPRVYNAAFLFRPFYAKRERYEKRVLVPLAEYIPFQWCKKFLVKYGIEDSFTPGKEAKVFEGKKGPVGISICYEETYGHLMRESRLKGAQLLINLTNDVWYPHSRLPYVHFLHGRIRSVEGGVPVVRASNTGVTCAVDSLGRTVAILNYENQKEDCLAEALYVTLPSYHYSTLYSHYGDQLIVYFSMFAMLVGFLATYLPVKPIFLDKVCRRNF